MKEDLEGIIPENPFQKENQKKGLSRRGFLKGAGLTAAGTAIVNTGLLGMSSEPDVLDDSEFGPDAVPVKLKINGQIKRVMIEPRATLAHTLRDHLELTGTKVVCDRGSCSACTVWVNGKPVNSCSVLALDVIGKEITTIEGLSKNGELHPVQQAFIDHDASQCGYCTPGMIMSAVHLLNKNSNPTFEDVKFALRGNLCRCGTYPHVFNATLDAAKKM